MNINGKKIKEVIAKGAVLLTLTGTLVTKNPISTNNDVNIVYAASDFNEEKSNLIQKLREVYGNYSKRYYTTNDYKKLKKYYTEGKKAIKKSSNINEAKTIYTKYENKLKSIKPTKLISYQRIMEKELLRAYKKLIKKNTYSTDNLKKLENIKNEGIETIYSVNTQKLSEVKKNTYLYRLNNVKTLIDETRQEIIDYIKSCEDLTKKQKNKIIKNINKLNNVEDIKKIGEIYGYGYTKQEREYITVSQIEKRIKELAKKYPNYTEDEVRLFVATANMDYVQDEDIFTIFKVNSNNELEQKKKDLDAIMYENFSICMATSCEIEIPNEKIDWNIYKATYDKMIKVNECYINKEMRQHADYMCSLIEPMIFEGLNEKKFHTASIKLAVYFYNKECINENYKYDTEKAINIDDEKLSNGSGYLINKYILELWGALNDNYYARFLGENDLDGTDKRHEIIDRYDNFITKRTKYQKVKK